MNNPEFAPQQTQPQPDGTSVQFVAAKSNTGRTIAIVLGSVFAVIVLFVGGMTFLVHRQSQKIQNTFQNISSTLPQ
jgi:Ca2+/Na+ antiporter